MATEPENGHRRPGEPPAGRAAEGGAAEGVPAVPARRWSSVRRAGSGAWHRVPPRLRMPLLVYLATQIIYLFWWVAFYPGLTSYDSVAYVWQVTTGNWSTNHSVLYNVLVWLSIQLSGGIGLLSLAQTVAMAAGIAYAVGGLRALGGSGRWLALAAVAVAVLPPIGTFVVFVWKDVAFVIVQVFLLGTLARIVVVRRGLPAGRWIRDRRMRNLLLLVFAEFLMLALFRQNGQLMVLVTAAVATVVIAGVRLWLAAAGIAAALLSVVLNLWIYPAVGVTPAKSDLLLGPAYADIAVAYHDRPADFTAADRAVMARVAPLSVWSDSANCYTSDTTTAARGFSREAAERNDSDLFALWVRLVKRMPEEMIDTRMCRGSIAWQVSRGPDRIGTVLTPYEGSRQLFGFGSRMDGNPYRSAVYLAPLNGAAHEVGLWLRKASGAESFKWILWRGATWCYLGYAAIILFVLRRREPAILALAGVALANQLVVLVNNPSQLVRYMMGPIFLGILVLPLMFARGGARPRPAPPAAPSDEAVRGTVDPVAVRPRRTPAANPAR